MVPIFVGCAGGTTSLVLAAQQHNSVATIISALFSLSTLGLFIGMFLYNWIRFFAKIKYITNDIFVIPNHIFDEMPSHHLKQINTIYTHLTSYVSDVCSVLGIYNDATQNKKWLKNLVVVFVNDFDEDVFNKRFGTTYKKIAGLCGGTFVSVEYNISHYSLLDTALEYEMTRVIMMNMKETLNDSEWRILCDKLKITKW